MSGCTDGSGRGHAEYLQLNTVDLCRDDGLEDMRDYRNCSMLYYVVLLCHKPTRCYIGFSCKCLLFSKLWSILCYGRLFGRFFVGTDAVDCVERLVPKWCVTCWVECYALHANSVAVAS